MAAISVETKPAAQVFPVSPLCTPNRTPSQSPSKLLVHSFSADVHPSEILPQDYNGNVSLSVSPALHGGEDSTMDIMGIKIGMIIDLDNPAGVSCDFCGGNYKDDVCKQCLRVNHPKYQPMNSDRPKSAPPYNCDTLKETSCKCDCKSGDEDIIQNLRNSNSGPKSLLENSKHSGSHRKSHSKKLKRTGSSRKHNGKRTACSVDTSGSLDNTQDNRDTKHVRKFRSNDPSNATIGTYPHTTISVGTGNKHQSESLLHTSQEDIPGLTPILQEENIMDRKKDDNDKVSNTPNGEDPEYVQILKNEPEATFSLRTLTRKQKCIVLSFCIVGFANYLCLSLIAPFFPKEARNKGISNMVSGWIFAAFPLTQFIFAPAFGKLIPIVGLKFMHLSGTFVGGGCTILFGMMEYVDVNDGTGVFITMCFILRFVQALGCCANQTASFSLCAQEFRDTVGTIFGMGEVFVGLGFMCGPAIGGVLYGIGGFVLPFAVIGGIIIGITVMNYWIVPTDSVVPDQTQQTGNKMSLFKLFKSYSTIVNCFTIVIAAMIWSILDPTLEPHLEEFNLSSELIGLLFLLMAAVYAIASPFWGRISDKMTDSRPILVIGCLMSSGGMLLLGPSTLLGFQQDDNILWLNVVSLVIIGIADSAAIIPTFDLLFKIAEDRGFENNINTFGIISGVWASMYALGDFLGPAVGGFLLDEIGFQSMTTYIAFLTVATAAFLFINILVDCACKSRKSAKKGSAEETSPLLSQKQDTDRYTENSDFLNTYPPQQLATEQV